MESHETIENPALRRMVDGLREALGDRLLSVVLYGSAARGDFQKATSDLNLLVVLENLEPGTLERLKAPAGRWAKAGNPFPRILSPAVIHDSADVFPIEFLDLRQSRVVLAGPDPFAGLEVRREPLRLQCERELREKMMRLREGYVEAHDRPRDLRRLLTESYTTFVALFRGCLHLLGGEVPVRNEDVVKAFCVRAGLDGTAFDEVGRLKRGESDGGDLRGLFARYYSALSGAVRAVDGFQALAGGEG